MTLQSNRLRWMILSGAALLALASLLALFPHNQSQAASHREAPAASLDRAADITDFFAFRSYEPGREDTVTFILNVDPLLEPSNGPNYFPFDPEILYQIKIDNNQDALEDICFEFRFDTEVRAPGVFTGFVGAGEGINAPANAPLDADGNSPAGQPLVPPAVTALDGSGSEGLSLRQSYQVTMVSRRFFGSRLPSELEGGQTLYAVPSNVGPRTMPDYESLAPQGIYELGNGIRVFAGTVDDPFYIDLGAAFDSLNFRNGGVLSPDQDGDDTRNAGGFDSVAGFNVNAIAIEVPISLLLRNGQDSISKDDPLATIGAWGTTSRRQVQLVRTEGGRVGEGRWVQIQRMANPLFNELLIGTGAKDAWGASRPVDESDFASFFSDPFLARVLNGVFGIDVPDAPRQDLAPLVVYDPLIAAQGTQPGPLADLLRLNLGEAPTDLSAARRMGLLAGDTAGFPNGRRVFDDVTDIATRVVAGVLNPEFNVFPNNRLGDGVNTNDVPYQEVFPYVAFAHSGRDAK